MPKRSSKKLPPADENQAAFDAVAQLTGQANEEGPSEAELRSEAARILGRLGGSKGGKERARRLSKARRSEIARKGAKARWKGQKKG
jgi:hypothetical protein